MKNLFFIFLLLFNFEVLHSKNKITNIPATSDILPNDGIYKINNNYYFNIRITLKNGWKTYWLNPGDAGLPIQVDLDGSEKNNFKILFPYPKSFVENGIKTIGYEKIVNFPVEIEINKDQVYKKMITLNYLVCKDICIPITERKKININPNNIVSSKDFITNFEKIPKINPKKFEVHELKFLKSNKIRASIKSDKKFELKTIFAYSEESPLTVNIHDKSNTVIELVSDIPFDELTKPIKLVFENENGTSEVNFKAKNLKPKKSLIYYYFIAFIGGLILNFMPCVLPIISIKLLSFASMIEQSKNKIRLSCFNIILGIITSFLFLAIIVISFKALGNQVGWGFHFQNKYFIIFITTIIFIFSLNLIGYFEFFLPKSLNNKFNNLINNSKSNKEFLGGVFATFLATPCSAPFLGTAVGFSMLSSYFVILGIFFSISIGFSFPYLMCIFFPRIIKIIPKPGEWMVSFKFFLGLLLLISTGWFLNLLKINLSLIFIFLALILMIAIIKTKFKKKITIVSFITISLVFIFGNFIKDQKALKWEAFDELNISNYIKKKEIVFLDVTADWCITCQINKVTTINTSNIKKIFEDNGVRLIQADWTNKDPEILKFISNYGKYGIPVNIIYSSKFNEGILLPEILSQDILKKELRKVINEN